jgi:methyl-accepting chemotaxis protein
VYGIDFSLGIVSLIRGFTAIAARFGSGDFSVRIDPRRKNEFGVMAGHFNSVAAALGVLIGQLLYTSGNLSESTSKLTAAAEISSRSAAAGEIAASVNRLRSSARRSKKEAKGK